MVKSKTDIRLLYESTDIPRLWSIFSHIISIGGATKAGFNLMGFQVFALGLSDLQVNITHEDFWSVMEYFLNARNRAFIREMKKGAKNGR